MPVCGPELGYLTQGILLSPYIVGMARDSPSFLMNGPRGKEFRMLLAFYFSFEAAFLDSREVTSAARDRKEQNESSQALMRFMRDPFWD